jgi:hypothetical protein
MASEYFIMERNQQKGPFSMPELKKWGITKETYVWCEGMPDWTKAGEVFELKAIFDSPDNPFPSSTSIPPEKAKNKGLRWLYTLLGLLALGAIAFVIIQNVNSSSSGGGSSSDDSYQEQVQSIEEIEAASPLQFLDASGTYTENLLGTKFKVKCEITNSATVVSYKDVVVKVTYYTKTNTVIGSEEHTLYEVFKPNSTKTIDLKVTNYSNVATIGWDVVYAKVY